MFVWANIFKELSEVIEIVKALADYADDDFIDDEYGMCIICDSSDRRFAQGDWVHVHAERCLLTRARKLHEKGIV